MNKYLIFVLLTLYVACAPTSMLSDKKQNTSNKILDHGLPTIGILVFEGVIFNEVMAPLDVFSKSGADGKPLFNIVLIAKEREVYTSVHGLQFIPDITIDDAPDLEALVVPSSYSPHLQAADPVFLNFIKKHDKSSKYTASHCAGAWLLAASGIADEKNIVTYVTGGKDLQKEFPNVRVADDSKVSIMEDENLITSNGNLVSYLASLQLLGKLTSEEHKLHVESLLYLDRLRE